MSSRILKSIVCAAFFAPVVFFAGTGSAQKKTEDQPVLNLDNSKLTYSLDGATLYKAYCATCHGTDGKGIGPMTEWLKIKSPDLTRLTTREGGKFPLVRIQRVIAGEENITAGHGTREMPIWGPVFSKVTRDEDLGPMRVYNVAKYVETIQIKK
jgi:mono/diheme cytochrome c family protein